MPTRVTVIGDALVDELADEGGASRLPGGSALNVAVGLSILGVPTTLVAMVGDDEAGDLLRAHLSHHDVELRATPSPQGTGVARSEMIDGEPRYEFNKAAVARAVAFDRDQREAIMKADVVAISGFPFDDTAQATSLTRTLGESSGRIALDANPRAGLIRDHDGFRTSLERLHEIAWLVKIGEEDARLLYGRSVQEVAPRVARSGSRVLATAGPSGASLYAEGKRWDRASEVSPSEVVDTIGAGDATFASILASVAEANGRALDWGAALSRAMVIAGATVRRSGALLQTSP